MILKRRSRYRVRWRENGILRQKTCRTLEEARTVEADKILKSRQAAPPVQQPNIKLKAYAAQWLKQIDVARQTKASYTKNLDKYILPVLGTLKVRQIHREHIRGLLANAKKRNGSPLSKNSLRLIRATLSVMLGDAVEAGIIGLNPCIGLARKGRKQAGTLSHVDRQRSVRPLSYEQLSAFLRAAEQHCPRRDAVLFLTLADTGMRPSEALALRWQDVDTTGRTIHIEHAVSGDASEIKPTKTETARTVDLSTRLAEALAGWQASLEVEALTSQERNRRAPSQYVFASRTRKPLEPMTIARLFQAVLRQAGLPRFKLYDLRHTYATQLLAEGAPITYVSHQLGHARPATTLTFYAHWLPRGDKTYIDRLTAAREAAGDFVVTSGRRGKA